MKENKYSDDVGLVNLFIQLNYDAPLYVAQYGIEYLLRYYKKNKSLTGLKLDYDLLQELGY